MTQTVSKWMTRDVLSTHPSAPLFEGVELMADKGIRHVLVLKDDRLQGILSNRDVVRATMTNPGRTLDLHGTTVEQIMTKAPLLTIHPQATLSEASNLFLDNKINALPVLGEAGELLGILTTEDMLRAVARDGCSLKRPDL